MMPAEQWYEHQNRYKRYGLDMKPRQVKEEKAKAKSAISSKDKFRLLLLTVFVGILCISLIITTAYAAAIKCNINAVIAENNIIVGEIENLNVKIKTASNIETIETRAITELGMVSPDPSQVVYINQVEEPSKEFALVLIQQAYN